MLQSICSRSLALGFRLGVKPFIGHSNAVVVLMQNVIVVSVRRRLLCFFDLLVSKHRTLHGQLTLELSCRA